MGIHTPVKNTKIIALYDYYSACKFLIEPRYDKTNKVSGRPSLHCPHEESLGP